MKELDPSVLLAVFLEMLGPMLWVIVGVALLAIVGFAALIVRERKIVSRRFVRAEVIGLLGGVVALVIMARVSSSGFTDAGGPADWILIAIVYGIGAVASTILGYAVLGWLERGRGSAAG
jgi:hypothetical protein